MIDIIGITIPADTGIERGIPSETTPPDKNDQIFFDYIVSGPPAVLQHADSDSRGDETEYRRPA